EHAAYVAAEVAAALHAAHTAADSKRRPLRIVHRDVSPSNIIASYTGEVKLCDFGIAKATLSRVTTKTGVIKGKVKYMSPEQALGRKLDHRSDVFSLGSCLYEMLTRVPPFTASNEMDLLIKVRDAKYRPVSELTPGIPPELEQITDKCLTRSRANRYQTAAEAEGDLRAFLRKFMPNYSRSHLGRFIRKMFATEIERELRMLEEYVLDEDVSDDLGESLMARDEDFEPPEVPFQPKPTSVSIIAVRESTNSSNDFVGDSNFTTMPKADAHDESLGLAQANPIAVLGPTEGTLHGQTGGTLDAATEGTLDGETAGRLAQPPEAIDAAIDPALDPRLDPRLDPAYQGDLGHEQPTDRGHDDIHGANTMILDHRGRHSRTPEAMPREQTAREPPARPSRSSHPPPPRDYDEDLHSAPTMIIDVGRLRGRR
ncbi:MAG TPA: serine/threonine-protein kinase, partial [Kofleriaceae bacterium]|nr:serine/threonine-protein kinase [Kofleriaceae bacterium]